MTKTIEDSTSALQPGAPTEMLKLKNVQYTYSSLSGGFRLGPLSVSLRGGRLVFWIGPNGSGKTTLAKLLCGDLRPSSGTVSAPGGKPFIYHRQTVEHNVFPDLTLREHATVLRARIDETGGELRDLLPSSALWDRFPDEVSGGQIQRFAFATLFWRKPEKVVLDEPFNHLDRNVSVGLCHFLRSWVRASSGRHAIVITHELDLAATFADDIVVLSEGAIIETLSNPGLTSEALLGYMVERT